MPSRYDRDQTTFSAVAAEHVNCAPLEAREPASCRFGDQFARVDAELLEPLRVLLVIDLLGQRVERVLNLLALSCLLKMLDDEALVDVHGPRLPACDDRKQPPAAT